MREAFAVPECDAEPHWRVHDDIYGLILFFGCMDAVEKGQVLLTRLPVHVSLFAPSGKESLCLLFITSSVKMLGKSIFALATCAALASAVPGRRQTNSSGSDIVIQQPPADLVKDPLVYGPEIELVHLFYDEWPTGMINLIPSIS